MAVSGKTLVIAVGGVVTEVVTEAVTEVDMEDMEDMGVEDADVDAVAGVVTMIGTGGEGIGDAIPIATEGEHLMMVMVEVEVAAGVAVLKIVSTIEVLEREGSPGHLHLHRPRWLGPDLWVRDRTVDPRPQSHRPTLHNHLLQLR